MTVILKLFNIMLDMPEWVYYLPRFPFCPGLGQHLSLLRWRAGEWVGPSESLGPELKQICLDLWLSSDRCAGDEMVDKWGPTLYISISDLGMLCILPKHQDHC